MGPRIYSTYLPMMDHKMNISTRLRGIKKGGSVLLSRGGPGAGSSYSSLEEYNHTNNFNSKGKGLGNLVSRLQNLSVRQIKKPKNIHFSI